MKMSDEAKSLIERLRDFPQFYSSDGAHWYRGTEKEKLTQEVASLIEHLVVELSIAKSVLAAQSPAAVSMADALKAHIEQCPQHPMSALKKDIERLAKDAERIDFVETALCRPGDIVGQSGAVIGIMKCWQIVTQRNDSLRETIDTLQAALAEKESK